MWSFDGSSTEQADGSDSDCLLKPVACFPDPGRKNAYLVMTEVLNADGTPHESNGRATINDDDEDFWFGFEQEYFLWDPSTDLPPGFPRAGYPRPQGPYYCSVGANNAYGRGCIEEHLDACLEAGINVEGINAEVAAGQWEFQVFAKGAKRAGDRTGTATVHGRFAPISMAALELRARNEFDGASSAAPSDAGGGDKRHGGERQHGEGRFRLPACLSL